MTETAKAFIARVEEDLTKPTAFERAGFNSGYQPTEDQIREVTHDTINLIQEALPFGEEQEQLIERVAKASNDAIWELNRRQPQNHEAGEETRQHIEKVSTGTQKNKQGLVLARMKVVLTLTFVVIVGYRIFHLESAPQLKSVSVPNLIGKDRDSAQSLLSAMGLHFKVEGEDYQEGMSAGVIFQTEPDSGTIVMPNSSVKVWISKGKRPQDAPEQNGNKVPEENTGDQQDQNGNKKDSVDSQNWRSETNKVVLKKDPTADGDPSGASLESTREPQPKWIKMWLAQPVTGEEDGTDATWFKMMYKAEQDRRRDEFTWTFTFDAKKSTYSPAANDNGKEPTGAWSMEGRYKRKTGRGDIVSGDFEITFYKSGLIKGVLYPEPNPGAREYLEGKHDDENISLEHSGPAANFGTLKFKLPTE